MCKAMTNMTYIYSIILVTIIIFIIRLYFKKKFSYWKSRHVEYPEPHFPLGNVYPMFALKYTAGHWLGKLYNEFKSDYFGIYAFSEPILVLRSPKIIKEVLIKNFSSFNERSIQVTEKDEVLSNFLFFKQNPAWKNIRSKMTPVFTSGKIKLMFPLIVKEAEVLVQYLKSNSLEKIDIKEVCTKYTANVIAKCAFAVDARCFENDKAEFRALGRALFAPSLINRFRFFAGRYCTIIVKLFDLYLLNPTVTKTLRNIFTNVLYTRQNSNKARGKDLIDILLQLKESKKDDEDFSDLELVGLATNFFAAGFETVAGNLSFILYELCLAQDIQDKLREEIRRNISENGGITYEGISEMKYLDKVVCEGLRKYPVIAFIDRQCTATFKLPDDELVIEKGTAIYIPIFGLHYDENYFPSPEKFDPERFENKLKINNDGYYLPFGIGPRNCIGDRFGLTNMKIAIVNLLINFKLEAIPETPVPIVYNPKTFTLTSTVGLPMKLISLETKQGN